MDSEGQGWKDRALNHEDRIAVLEARTEQECIDDTFTAIRTNLLKAEAKLAERDRMLDDLYGDYEAEWTEERGQFVQHDRWLADLRGRPAEGEVTKPR